jgi:hypothetical protein
MIFYSAGRYADLGHASFIHELRDVLIATVAVAVFFGVAILIALAFSGHLSI